MGKRAMWEIGGIATIELVDYAPPRGSSCTAIRTYPIQATRPSKVEALIVAS